MKRGPISKNSDNECDCDGQRIKAKGEEVRKVNPTAVLCQAEALRLSDIMAVLATACRRIWGQDSLRM